MSLSELIDRLGTISHPGLGYLGHVTGCSFEPIPSCRHTYYGRWPPPHIADNQPALRAVVERGASMIPLLLEHLTDDRPTACETELPGFPFVERHLDLLEAKGSLELEFENKLRNAKSYHLTIGDMCYIALGQIVNRNYSAVYYQPSANVIINSPVVCLAVAESARKQWSSIDEPSHRESLISDLSNIAIRFRREDAITRLMYYYPDAGTWCACAELQRPFYSVYSVEDLLVELSDAVFDGFDPAAVRRILESCDEHTAAGAVERFRQGEFAWPVVAPQLAGIKPWADEILSELSATIETAPSCAISAAHQVRFVEHLIPFASPAIDNALDRVFRVALRKRSCLRYDIDHLLLACARRLIRNPSRATEIRDTIAEQAHELVSNLDDSESQ